MSNLSPNSSMPLPRRAGNQPKAFRLGVVFTAEPSVGVAAIPFPTKTKREKMTKECMRPSRRMPHLL